MSTATPYLTTAEVADRLGIKPATVRTLVSRDGLPAHYVARSFKFIPAEVDAWLRSRDSSGAVYSPDPAWVEAQVANFTPADLRRAAEVLASVAASLETRTAVSA